MFFATLFGFLFLIPVALYVIYVYCWYRIMQKANYGNWGLLAIIAPTAVILLIILAFGPWHAAKEDGTCYEKINPAS
jgi:uncharacterized membrane protein